MKREKQEVRDGILRYHDLHHPVIIVVDTAASTQSEK
jgi:hypothetical protein